MQELLSQKWTTTPAAYYILPFHALALIAFLALIYALWKRHETVPLILNVAIIIFSLTGISISLYPQIIPNVINEAVTLQKAASGTKTLFFMLIVLGAVIPIILIYTTYEFWVFHGKASAYYNKDEE